MKLWLTKNKNKTKYDITQMVSSFTWGGSLDTACRSLGLSVINAPYDSNMKSLPSIALADLITLKDDAGNVLFYGMVYEKESTADTGTESYTCYDMLYHLTRSSWSKKFTKTTAEKIAKQCCKEAGITAGSIKATKASISKLIVENETIYDTMLKAFKKASKSTGKKYLIKMEGSKLTVIEKGYVTSKIIISDKTNLTSATIHESAADIVNRVKIYNDKNKQIGVVSDNKSIGKYGVFQTTYKKEEGVKASVGAKAQYVSPTQDMTIEVLGDLACTSGYAVEVKDGATGLSAKYWITEDQHTFENGQHTMSLTLSYKNTMS